MSMHLKELRLSETYEFDLVVEVGSHKYSGELKLSPEKILFKVLGEQHSNRGRPLDWRNQEKIVCSDFNNKFILCDLMFVGGRDRTLTRHPEHIGFFEMRFEVGSVLFCPSTTFSLDSYEWMSIHSASIGKWIGMTEAQAKNLDLYHKSEPFFGDGYEKEEFRILIEDIGTIGVEYNLSMYSTIDEFKSGMEFPPSFFMVFTDELSSKDVKPIYDTIYSMLAVLIGSDFDVDKIEIGCESLGYNQTGSLYYPFKASKRSTTRNNYVFFPLGKDLKYDTLGLPSFPLASLGKFFCLSDEKQNYFNKYLHYSRMENVEERFLGFFRILETLCFKQKSYLDPEKLTALAERATPYLTKVFGDKKSVKSFVKGINRYNYSKYNTEKCIQDFFITLPNSVSDKWRFNKSSIVSVCKLRNDITHANTYYMSERELEANAKFIEALLVFSLLDVVGVDVETTGGVINRLSGYHLICENQA